MKENVAFDPAEVRLLGANAVVLSDKRFHLLIIVVLSAVMLFANLHKGGLSGYDDAVYAHEGKQMLLTGDWRNIRINGVINFEYPPLFIWMEAASMKMFGISDFAAKFPSALCGLLTIILVFFITRELTEDFNTPIIAAWVLMLTQYFMKYAMHAMTDVPFTFFFTLALFFYVKGLKKPLHFILCGVAVASAIMTRSVLGVIPLAVIFSHLILTRQFKVLFSKELIIGVLLAFLLPAIWYFPNYQTYGGDFLRLHFSFISSKVSSEQTFNFLHFLRGLVEYPWLLLKMYQPWLIVAVIGLIWHFKTAFRERDSAAMFLLLWVFWVIVPFSLVEAKVLRYIMPIFPALAILAATPIENLLARIKQTKIKLIAFTVLCLAVLLIVAFPNPRLRAEEMKLIAPAVDRNTPTEQRVMVYTSGELQHNYINQLVWYSNRFGTHLKTPKELLEKLRSNENLSFVVSKPDFEQIVKNAGVKVEVHEQTENFVYFRTVL